MEIRYTTNPEDFKSYTTERLRKEFLIEDLFQAGEIKLVYSHYDRAVIGGIAPAQTALALETIDALKTDYFFERREAGLINIGGSGSVRVGDTEYELERLDALYIGKGHRKVEFSSKDPGQPAKFYFFSALAHAEYPVQKLSIGDATPKQLGTPAASNERTLYQYIHAGGLQSCQVMMGVTILKPNNMWNTMPAHLHDRRMEAYIYFDLEENDRVIHLMGQPEETRHLVVRNEQAILSPSWSIHSGVGTGNYAFIWAMAGENYTFTDMDTVEMKDLK